MPQVPENANIPSVTPTSGGLSSTTVTPPAESFAANVLGSGLSELGKTESQISDQLFQHAQTFAALNNKAIADEANSNYTKTSDADIIAPWKDSNRGLNAYQNLHQVQDQLETARLAHRNQLTNPMAQELFDSDSRRYQQYQFNGLTSYAVGEREHYLDNAYDSKIKLTTNELMLAGNDPKLQQQAVDTIKSETSIMAARKGLDPASADLAQQQAVGKAWHGVITDQATRDAEVAWKMAQDHKADLGIYYPEVEHAIRPALVAQISADAAKGLTVAGVSAGVAGNLTTDNIRSLERSPVGSTSSKGARGLYQITPGFAATYGIDYSRANDPAYQDTIKQKIEQNFLPEVQKLFPGDGQAQAVAYHNGIGGAQAWVASGRTGQGVAGFGPESQGYAGRASGAGGSLDALEAGALGIQNRIPAVAKQYADQYGLSQSELEDSIRARVDTNIRQAEFGYQQQSASVISKMMGDISQSEADGNPTNPDTFFKSPGNLAAFNSLQGRDQQQVLAKLNESANYQTTARRANFFELYGKSPQDLMNTDLSKYDLTRSDYKYFNDLKVRDQRTVEKQGNEDAEIRRATALPVVAAALKQAGIADTTSPAYLRFQGMLRTRLEALGEKKISDSDVARESQTILATPENKGILGINFGPKWNDVSIDDHNRILQHLQTNLGIVNPSEEDIGRYAELERMKAARGGR